MVRPLRITRSGCWYHLTARGNERRAIYRAEDDRLKFLALLESWIERYRIRLHSYVLMDNHYHLLAETRESNLSESMQWLNVSYSVWFDRRHGRDVALYLGRKQGRLRLRQLGELAEVDYGSVSMALQRFERRLQQDSQLARYLRQAKALLFNV
jgi:REP element-mobilizing transposase RayT